MHMPPSYEHVHSDPAMLVLEQVLPPLILFSLMHLPPSYEHVHPDPVILQLIFQPSGLRLPVHTHPSRYQTTQQISTLQWLIS